MRVIAGTFRSRTLRSLKGQALRPTSDRLRETLFNIIGPEIADTVFLDLYAGTGAVGIEAISRGARTAIFAEKQRAAVDVIHHNLENLNIGAAAEVIAAEVLQALKRLETRNVSADFIFLDPPYDAENQYERVLEFLGMSRILSAGGKVIAEHSRKLKLPKGTGKLELVRVLEQGDSALSFYAHADRP